MNRSSFVSKLFTPVITLLVLAYFGYQIYGYVSDPFSTTLAYTYQVEDTVDISGYVVRQEQVLTGDAGGLMRLRKNEGERGRGHRLRRSGVFGPAERDRNPE